LPQALQKCTSRIVPQDQQADVASPGMIRLDFDSGMAINTFTTDAQPCFARLRWPGPKVAPWCRSLVKGAESPLIRKN